jgi:hypothetical protein
MHPAQARREQQLRQLVVEGVPLRTLGKSGHWILGPLHIYTASGRWLSAATGRRGRLNGHGKPASQQFTGFIFCVAFHVIVPLSLS